MKFMKSLLQIPYNELELLQRQLVQAKVSRAEQATSREYHGAMYELLKDKWRAAQKECEESPRDQELHKAERNAHKQYVEHMNAFEYHLALERMLMDRITRLTREIKERQPVIATSQGETTKT
ncbi:MAG: hypothetical protein ACK5OQ_16535 [Burkholderiales bacterium]|jgi:hypothetical protein